MMYLSQLFLDPVSRQVQKELVYPYEMHRTLSHAFASLDKAAFKEARVLFRVDTDKESPYILVQSKVAPDWDAFQNHLSDKRYLLASPKQTVIDLDNWDLSVGKRLRFRLQANPTFRPFIQPEKRTRKTAERVGLYREHERLDWLLHRAKEHGFALETQETTLHARIKDDGTKVSVQFRNKEYDKLKLELPIVEVVDLNNSELFSISTQDSPKTQKNFFSAVRFDGLLQITDTEKFTKALLNGIGPAKGYGFGLLSLARA